MLPDLYHNPTLKRFLGWIAARGDRPLPAATPREEELVAELRATLAALQPSASGTPPPSEQVWVDFARRFDEAVRTGDPREFLRWRVVQKAMFVSNQPYLVLEYLALRFSADWQSRWRPALQESAAGHPVPFALCRRSSGNLIHHAYHLAKFESLTQCRPEQFSTVIEFGGGYGSMCRLFHRLGFGGRYVILDLPPFSALQQFYLRMLGMRVRADSDHDRQGSGVFCHSPQGAVDETVVQSRENALFLGTWSISETPASVRDQYMPLAASCRGILIAYWRQFEEMNNAAYFTSWAAAHPEFRWVHMAIPTLPDHFYLFGIRKSSL